MYYLYMQQYIALIHICKCIRGFFGIIGRCNRAYLYNHVFTRKESKFHKSNVETSWFEIFILLSLKLTFWILKDKQSSFVAYFITRHTVSLFTELEKIQDMEKRNELQAGAVGVLAEECGRYKS